MRHGSTRVLGSEIFKEKKNLVGSQKFSPSEDIISPTCSTTYQSFKINVNYMSFILECFKANK